VKIREDSEFTRVRVRLGEVSNSGTAIVSLNIPWPMIKREALNGRLL